MEFMIWVASFIFEDKKQGTDCALNASPAKAAVIRLCAFRIAALFGWHAAG